MMGDWQTGSIVIALLFSSTTRDEFLEQILCGMLRLFCCSPPASNGSCHGMSGARMLVLQCLLVQARTTRLPGPEIPEEISARSKRTSEPTWGLHQINPSILVVPTGTLIVSTGRSYGYP
eukprot:scaffold26324_cov40-Prasinocladus_malaysianus.AAC.1